MTRHVDYLARHVRRLGNHELNELLLQLPQPSFAALVKVALARPVLPAGLVLRFEPAPGVDGWAVVACAPRRRLGTLTRDRDPDGRLAYRAWTRAGDPVQVAGAWWWRRRRDAAAALAWVTRQVGLAVWPWPPMSVPSQMRPCTTCFVGCLGSGSTGWWTPPIGPKGRRHDRRQALPSLRPAQVGCGVLSAPPRPAVRLLPALHSRRLPRSPEPSPTGPGCGRGAAGGRPGPSAPPAGPGRPRR